MAARRQARIEITADPSRLDPGLREAKQKLHSFERETVSKSRMATQQHGGAAKAMNAVGGTARNAASGMMAVAGVDIVGTLVSQAQGVMNFERSLTRLQIAGEMATSEVAEFRTAIDSASKVTGEDRDQLLAAASGYVKFTGDAKGAREQLEMMGKVMKATGASAEEVSGVNATFKKNFNFSPAEMTKAWDVLIAQGHKGGIEINDLAASFTKVAAAQATMFVGGASLEGLSHASALAQILNNSTHDADLTSTLMKDMFLGFEKHAKKLRQHRIDPFAIDPATGEQKVRDAVSILHEIDKKVPKAKRMELLHDLFPDIRENSAVTYLLSQLGAVDELIAASKESNQLQKDYDIYANSSAGKLEAAWNKVKVAIAEAMTPERIKAFVAAVEKLFAWIVKIIEAYEFIKNGRGTEDQQKKVITGGLFEKAHAGDTAEERAASTASAMKIAERIMLVGGDALQGTTEKYDWKLPNADAPGLNRGAIDFAKSQAPERDISSYPGVGIGPNWEFQPGARKQEVWTGAGAASAMRPEDLSRLALAFAAAVRDNLKVTVQADKNTIATSAANSINPSVSNSGRH